MKTMRTQWTMSVCGVLLASALASAQPPPATQPPATQPSRPQPQDPTPFPAAKPPELQKPQPKADEPAPAGRLTRSELKLTGCLQRAEETAGAARDATPAAGDRAPLAGGFVLRQATPTRSKDTKEPATASGKEYRLVAKNDSIKLADHVGHQVSIEGQVTLGEPPAAASTDASTSSSRPSGSTGVDTPPSGKAATMAPAVTVSVSSLKMVSASCSTPAS
jgi:hypothetical protein